MSYIEQKIKIVIENTNLHKVKEALITLNEVGALSDYDSNNTKDDIMSIIERLEKGKFILNKDKLNSKVFESIRKYYKCNEKSTDLEVSALIRYFELNNCEPSYWNEISRTTIDTLRYNFDSVDELILELKMRDIFTGYVLYDFIISSFPETDFSDFLFNFE